MEELYPNPRKGKGKSEVWDHFGFMILDPTKPPKEGNLDMQFVYCKYCKKAYKNHKATTTMMFHLESEHKLKMRKSRDPVSICNTKKENQLKITSFTDGPSALSTAVLSKEKQGKIEKALIDLFIDKMLPFSLLEHDSFITLLNELDPRYKVPEKKSVLTKINDKYKTSRSKLQQELAESSYVALTHDYWTSLMTEGYDTVTSHYITHDWVLRSAVLQTSKFQGAHTGENISNHLAATIKEWNIKTPVFVTDNAVNEVKAVRLLGLPRIGCYGHRLNLVVKHALSSPEPCKLITKGPAIVTFFHVSTSATELLLEKQKLLLPVEKQNHRLIQDVST